VIDWAGTKRSLLVGSLVSCAITRHAPFGVFAYIAGIPFEGLIQITDFKDEGRMTADEFPAVGSTIEAVVLGFKETGQQIWLGVKPSHFDSVDQPEALP
jgi:ribosomal protein S1